MPEEDLTRAGTGGPRHGRRGLDRCARHRSSTIPGRTRGAFRSLFRVRSRRRALEGIAALACLVALASYLSAGDGPVPAAPDPGRVPAGVGRPTGLAVVDGGPASAPASPGLRPRQRPPSPSPTPVTPAPTPPAPVLTLAHREAPAEVDLTAVGGRDWIHWGLRGDGTTVRKRGGSGEIRDDGGNGRRGSWDASQETFRWRDGDPVRSADGSAHGAFTCGAGKGFTLAVAASGEPRTLHVYAGTWRARGRLDVRLSSGGPARTLRLEDPHTSRSAEFTIRFQAARGARLVVTWTAEHAFTDDCAGITLQAVALR